MDFENERLDMNKNEGSEIEKKYVIHWLLINQIFFLQNVR